MEEKKRLHVKDEMEATSSAASKVEVKQEQDKPVQPPKVTKCRSKARIQKKEETLKMKEKLAKKHKQQEKQQVRIKAANAQALERVKREKEAEEWAAEMTAERQWPPRPVYSNPSSSEEESENSSEVAGVLSKDIP